ncbi:MAG: multicopper oxidase domain-containing protein [Chloroflexi bacterium]|nr:multicopper oxidase domain-containing protein [Chloroflexota bacterium]
MKSRSGLLISIGAMALVVAVVGVVLSWSAGSGVMAAPAQSEDGLAGYAPPARSLAETLPASTCTLVGSTRTCELWAKSGVITMPTGVEVPIWGFADAADVPAQLPGPAIIANSGETLTVVLHNALPAETVSLYFGGQSLLPDLTGVASGGDVTYTFPLADPGTFIYEAGLTENGGRQVAMGLYGGLIVRPLATGTQAYDDVATAYDDEALLILSELDPAFNNDPYNFRMEHFVPKYWLINGQAYPDIPDIPAAVGNTVLLRYINAGVSHRAVGALGLRQTFVAADGVPLPFQYTVVADTIRAGQTMDALTTVPVSAIADARYAIYDGTLMMHNDNQRLVGGELAFGGSLTFIRALSGSAPYDVGPLVKSAAVSPSPTTGATGATLEAVLDETTTGGADIVAAEYFVGSLGAPGTGTPIAISAPATLVNVSANVSAGTLAGWAAGYHTFYVRGQDANLNWGAAGSAVLNLDKIGPDSVSLSVAPNPTNGERMVTLRGTGSDHDRGNGNVVSATFAIDAGPAQPMLLNRTDAPIVGLSAVIPDVDVAALTEGAHGISVVSQDELGNWGVPAIVTLTIDKTGPAMPLVALTPSSLDLTGPPPVNFVRLDADITDALSSAVQSTLATAEGFIDNVGAPGTGFALFPSDGLFDEVSEQAFFNIPIVNFAYLSQGQHTVFVRGRDVAGNWGTLGSAVITIDRGVTDAEGPTIGALGASPNPTAGGAMVTLAGSATDPDFASNVAGAEWFIGDPGVGQGFPISAVDGAFDETSELLTASIDVSLWRNGVHTIWVRARDAAYNWGEAQSVDLLVTGNSPWLIFADDFEASGVALAPAATAADGLGLWSRVVGDVTTSSDAQMWPASGTLGMQATVSDTVPAYVALDLPAGEPLVRVSFYFDPNGTIIGTTGHDIMVGLNETPIFGIQVREQTLPGQYDARAWVLDNGLVSHTQWHAFDAPVKLGVRWQASAHAWFQFLIDDDVVEELPDLTTGAYSLHELRLGPSDHLGVGMSGVEYFDGVLITRDILTYMPIAVRGN